MKALIVKKYGKQQTLDFADIPEPVLQPEEVLIQIHASSVNLLDSKIRNGEFKPLLHYRVPFVLGHDVAGVVVRIGPKVSKLKIGDQVYARPNDMRIGSFAEFIAVKEESIAFKPANISMEEAASIPLVGLTAWQALVDIGQLQKGQKVFIQAGSGGVGTFAIQLAKYLGATVATTTSFSNTELVKSLGADVVIDYKSQDFEEILSDYDLVLNSQDGKTLSKSLNVLKPGGKVISISGPPDVEFAKSLNAPWLIKQLFRLLSLRTRKHANQREVAYFFLYMRANGEQLQKITQLIESGVIRPVLDRVFSLAETNEAMKYVESGRAKGKVVIKVLGQS